MSVSLILHSGLLQAGNALRSNVAAFKSASCAVLGVSPVMPTCAVLLSATNSHPDEMTSALSAIALPHHIWIKCVRPRLFVVFVAVIQMESVRSAVQSYLQVEHHALHMPVPEPGQTAHRTISKEPQSLL